MFCGFFAREGYRNQVQLPRQRWGQGTPTLWIAVGIRTITRSQHSFQGQSSFQRGRQIFERNATSTGKLSCSGMGEFERFTSGRFE